MLDSKRKYMIVSIKELQNDINERFKEPTTAGDFGVVAFGLCLKKEIITVSLAHYSDSNFNYRITFESFHSYRVCQEYLVDEKREEVLVGNFQSTILREIVSSKYMDFMLEYSDLKIFYEGKANNQAIQYGIYTQNFIITVISGNVPKIEIINFEN